MLFFALFCLICLIFVYFWRKMVIHHLSLQTRDTRALYAIRQVLRLVLADEKLAEFDPSKDRSAFIPGESRRKKMRPKTSTRRGALVALKQRLKNESG